MTQLFPKAPTAAEAEFLWRKARQLLAANGYPSEPARIHSLFFHRDSEPRVLQLGMEEPETGEPVLLILHAANAPFYWVCTPSQGILEGAPIAVPDREGTRAVAFGRKRAEPKRAGAKRRRS